MVNLSVQIACTLKPKEMKLQSFSSLSKDFEQRVYTLESEPVRRVADIHRHMACVELALKVRNQYLDLRRKTNELTLNSPRRRIPVALTILEYVLINAVTFHPLKLCRDFN